MDYHDGDGQNLINRWYESQDDKVKAHFHYVLNEVAVTRELDDSPSFNRLKYRHIGLFTIRFEVIGGGKKRQFRPVGFWKLNSNELILVDGCEKSGRFTIPPGVYETALQIQLEYYTEGKGMIYEHSF